MILTDTEDLESLREVTRAFFADVLPHGPVERTARVDRALWERACQQLGVAGVGVPEAWSGVGLGPAGIAIVLEEAGRALAPLPLLGSVVRAQSLLLASGDDDLLAAVLPDLLSGETVAAVADRDGDVPTTATLVSGQWILSGTKQLVLDGASADVFLVVAQTDSGPSLFLVDAAAVTCRTARSLDLTRDFASLRTDDAPGRLVGAAGGWAAMASAIEPVVTLALAAEALGSAQATLDQAVLYAQTRVQFGREIGSFQAIKHTLAEVAVLVDDARSAAEHAMWAADEDDDELPLTAAVAASAATAAQLRSSADNIQVHGGIGFTWEHTAHLHFRRARSNAAVFGGVREHHEAVLRTLGV